MAIQLVVFDMAGTTVSDKNYVGSAFQGAFNHFGFNFALKKINGVMGYDKSTAIRMMLKEHSKEITDQLVKDIHEDFVKRMVLFYESSKEIAPLPNVEKTFEALRARGIKVALETGFSRKIANVIVKRLGWEGKIDYLVASDEVPKGRPFPDMIEKIKTVLGIESSQAVAKVGDTGVDIQEGINSGCKYVIGITTGTSTREALAKFNPTHIVDDISEIIDIVTKSDDSVLVTAVHDSPKPSEPKIQLVVFDMAGTTVADKNYVGAAFQGAFNHFGFKFALDKLTHLKGLDDKTTAIQTMLKENVKEITDQLVKDVNREFVKRMVRFYETSKEIIPLPNVEKTFEALRARGIKVALETGFSRKIADVIVKRFGWEGKIDYLVASDEVLNGRPFPDMIDKIKTELGIESSNAVVKVGDTGVDIQEGINNGCKYVIGITTGTSTRDALAKFNPTHIVDDISEVINIVTGDEN